MKLRRIKHVAALMAVSVLATGIVAVLSGPAALATQSCPPHWDLAVVTNYGAVFKPAWLAVPVDNTTGITEGPFTYESTYTGSVSSTVSSSLNVSLGTDVSSISADLGISFTDQTQFTVDKTSNILAPPHATLHAGYGVFQYHTYDEHYYVTSTCQITNATYGNSYSNWQGPEWKIWTTAAT